MSTSLEVMHQRLSLESYSEKFSASFAQAIITKELKLNNMGLTSNELIEEILPFLNSHPSIHTLNVSWNEIGEAGAIALAANQNLRTLDVSNNKIGDTQAIALAADQCLRTLIVTLNQISEAGAIALAVNKSLRTLGDGALAANQSLETLDVNINQIGRVVAIALNQRNLDIVMSCLYDIGEAVVLALAANQSLQTLEVRQNQGEPGARALAANQSLDTLDVKYNNIGAAGRQALRYAFQSRINKIIKEKTAFLSVMTLTKSQAINPQLQDELNAKKQLTTLFKVREGIRDKSNQITNRLDDNSIKNIFTYLKAKPFTVKL